MDCYHLEYFSTKIHFAAHYASIYGYDDHQAYLNDTDQQGREARTSLESLTLARNEKGPMSSRNRSFVIRKKNDLFDLKKAAKIALLNNARTFLNPPITNLGHKGILKASTEIKKWFESSNTIETDFQSMAMLMERAGTGGALFRNLYRDFLNESAELLDSKLLIEAHLEYSRIAKMWTTVSELFVAVSETGDSAFINEASEVLVELSKREKDVMEKIYVGLNNTSGSNDQS